MERHIATTLNYRLRDLNVLIAIPCMLSSATAIENLLLVESFLSASHSQSVGIGSSSGISQHCHHITYSCARVSAPVDICCRPTGGDTGEGELRAGSIEVRVWCERHAGWNGDVSYSVMITIVNELNGSEGCQVWTI